jgi:BirA family transcriptional regulator, biotin operon repressor / biotin---[acetyl-CoA-carboxylase] ligase
MGFDSLDSTNAVLKRIVEQEGDVHEGLMISAGMQTEGRGRLGRVWQSPPGNVYVSILVSAPDDLSHAPELGFVAAVALRETIVELPRHNSCEPKISCKWPNDILVEGEKVAGILPEMINDDSHRNWIVLGIGVNLEAVHLDLSAFPSTALSLHGFDTTPAHVLTVLTRSLHKWLDRWRTEGFQVIRDRWLTCGPAIGTNVTIGLPEGAVSGAFLGLDNDGALLLDTRKGHLRIVAGDVLFGDAYAGDEADVASN